MSTRKLSPALTAEMLRLFNAGKNSEEIATWLRTEHQVEVSSGSVRKALRRRRSEIADVAKSVVREELRKHLLFVVDDVVQIIHRARRAERAAAAVGDIPVLLKAQVAQLKAAETIMHYAGLNQPDVPGAKSPSATDAREALLKRVQDLVDKVGTKDPKTEPSVH